MVSVVNPLGIPEIQDRICSNFSVAQLLNARVINSEFNQAASKQLTQANQAVTRFRNNEELTSFIEVMRNRIQEHIIYTQYKVKIKEISNELVPDFCSIIGPHVTLLTLEQSKYCQAVQPRSDEENKKILLHLLSSTRQLKYLNVCTDLEIVLTPEEQNLLADLQLQTLSIQRTFDRFNGGGNQAEGAQNMGIPLGLFLALNSRSLKEITVPLVPLPGSSIYEVPNIDFLKQIKVTVGRSICFVLLSICLVPDTLTAFQQLDQLGLKFRSMHLQAWNDAPALVEFLTQWIQKQEDYLEELIIQFHGGQIMGQLHFPNMKTLKKLSLTFSNSCDPAPTFATIGEGQFPSLKFLSLKYSDGFGVFCFPILKLTHLDLDGVSFGLNFTSEWHRILPKLKSLKFQAHVLDKTAAAKVSYLLTHFCELEELEVRIRRNSGDLDEEGADFWDILTGNAPRMSVEELLDVELHPISYRPPESRVSSLGNLKRLRKLTFGVGNWKNVEAILFLTASGAMKPLEILQILGRSCDLQDPEAYNQLLIKVHEVVKIGVECPPECY